MDRFINQMTNFISNIEKSLQEKYIIKYNIEIILNIKLYESEKIDIDNCNALVNNNINGKSYQCTRKKKEGHQYCGLHMNRKNIFKSVSTVKRLKQEIKTTYMINKTDIANKKYKVNNGYKEFNYNGNYYMYDTVGKDVYIRREIDDVIYKLGHIKTLNIPRNYIIRFNTI